MKPLITPALAAVSVVLGLACGLPDPAQAQGTGVTRAQVTMDRDAFLAMARWDDSVSNWVLKDGMKMPEGVLSREEVKAMRDKFLSMHTWDDLNSRWVPVGGTPRDMSKLTREQVAAETQMFLKMYRFDERTSSWVTRGG